MGQWPSRTHTTRLSTDGILSPLANKISLTLPWVGTTPFTGPSSDGPDLKTSPLSDKFDMSVWAAYGAREYSNRVVPRGHR